MGEPELTLDAAKAKVETLTKPRVTEAGIKDKIEGVKYMLDGITTICIITMTNGFRVIGHSTPASPENFNQDIGERYAWENTFRQIWQLEGYLLREKLFHGAV
jgi:Phage protein (N4 Gp49/phage Sf6 gene 66) family